MSRRRSSITVDRPPAYTTNQTDAYMDSSDSLSSNSSHFERPSTRSFMKTQNAQLANSVQVTSQAMSSNLKGFGQPFNNSVQIKKVVQKQQPPPPQTYQKIITSQKSNNLINILDSSILNGRRPNSISHFHDKTLHLLSTRLKTHDYPFLIKRLDQISVTLNFRSNSKEFYELMNTLADIEDRLLHYYPDPTASREQFREEFEVETINIESAKMFRQYGGIEIFKRIILMSLLITSNETLNDTTRTSRKTSKILSQNSTPTNIITESYSILKIKCKCIHILNRIVCLPNFGKIVVNDLLYVQPNNLNTLKQQTNDSNIYNAILLQYLFSLLMFKDSRLLSCQLIESILLHMPMLNLNRISNIKHILETIDDEGLASMCRIFAITLSDLDMIEKKYWIQKKQQTQQIKPNTPMPSTSKTSTDLKTEQPNSSIVTLSVRDQNQELLLNIPSLLNRLVNLVHRKDYAIRYPGTDSELEHWMRYLDEALSDTDDNEPSDLSLNNTQLISNNNNNPAITNSSHSSNNLTNYRTGAPENQLYQPALLAANKLNNFVHVLYTISLLLIGKERKRVQKSLTKLRLATALNSLFDYLVWNCRCEYHNSSGQPDQQQVRSHICPEVAVKIQFLRLVHSFCDHSEYKRVVLSRDEIEEIISYNKNANSCLQVPQSVLKIESRLGCTKEKVGLLTKIVQVIKQEPFSASFRFWLTRAIESFLRGGTSYADQLFLVNRGIVEDTLQNILAINFSRPKEVLQSCFDMLGELIKFNNKGFALLDNELLDKDKFNMLMRMINQSLVDSNMFLRSIFLSIEFFENNKEALDIKIESNQVLLYFSSFERRINLICKMINIVNLHNLSQENVSCLNTTIVLLMQENRKNSLPKYLKAMQEHSTRLRRATEVISSSIESSNGAQTSASAVPQPIDTMANFKELLVFWQGHYLQKDKDCIGLEQNSRIEFSYWKHTVELLLDTDIKNNCSLNYYLSKDTDIFDNKPNRIDEYRCD